MPAAPVRWGILGASRINNKVLAGARAADGVELAAIASRDPARATAQATEFSIATVHASYEALLADPAIDAVYISLPNALHHPWTLRSLEAGKHVLCEKPYSRHPAEVDEAWDLADSRGLLLMEAFMWRHSRQTTRFLALLAGIGELQAIHASFGFRLEDPADIRLRADLAGGALMDVGCYCVSGSRLLAGQEPDRVYGEATFSPDGVDTRFAGTLHFPSGLVATFAASFTAEHMVLEASGSNGILRADDPWHVRSGEIRLDGQPVPVDTTSAYRLELENLSAAIRGQATPLLGRADATGQARTIAALYESAARGRPVLLDEPGAPVAG
jgi:D-xylose 1-dehydrogenase (NADP+, D-xylono-1,5-lactone-forming)